MIFKNKLAEPLLMQIIGAVWDKYSLHFTVTDWTKEN